MLGCHYGLTVAETGTPFTFSHHQLSLADSGCLVGSDNGKLPVLGKGRNSEEVVSGYYLALPLGGVRGK